MVGGLLRTGTRTVRTVLDLGSGGGHVASHLSSGLDMTLVDMSPQMLEVSRRLNPGCEHVLGDMRTLRLDRRFDAVLVHDSIDYLLDGSEVAAMAATVAAHLQPGGVAVLVPDHITESFEPSTQWGGSDASDGRGARYLEWTWDPDPHDSWAQAEYSLVLREADGSVSSGHESHRFGLFSHQQWISMLDDAGLSAVAVGEQTDEDRPPRTLFVARARSRGA